MRRGSRYVPSLARVSVILATASPSSGSLAPRATPPHKQLKIRYSVKRRITNPHYMPTSQGTSPLFQEYSSKSSRRRQNPGTLSTLDFRTQHLFTTSHPDHQQWRHENYSRRLIRPLKRLQREFRPSRAYMIRSSRLPTPHRKRSWKMLSSERSRSCNGIETRLKHGLQEMR